MNQSFNISEAQMYGMTDPLHSLELSRLHYLFTTCLGRTRVACGCDFVCVCYIWRDTNLGNTTRQTRSTGHCLINVINMRVLLLYCSKRCRTVFDVLLVCFEHVLRTMLANRASSHWFDDACPLHCQPCCGFQAQAIAPMARAVLKVNRTSTWA